MKKNKKNLSEYIDYLIFEKRIFNSKITVFIFIGIFFIALFGVLISINNSKIDTIIGAHYTDEERISILEDFGYSNMEIENMSKEEIDSISNTLFINSRNQTVGDVWSKELDRVLASTLKNDYYKYASLGNYKDIVDDFNQQKQKYIFSEPYNQRLIRIYNDAYSLNAAFSNSYNKVLLENALNNLNDETMLLCAILQSDTETKNKVFKDRMSLSFTDYDNNVRIFTTKSGSMEYMFNSNMHKSDSILLRLFDYLNDGDYIIYKINFALNSDTFNAYLYKNCETSKLRIFGIYAENPSQLSIPYNTVAQLDSIFSKIEYEANNKDENSDINQNTEEQIVQTENNPDDTNASSDESHTEDASGTIIENPIVEDLESSSQDYYENIEST